MHVYVRMCYNAHKRNRNGTLQRSIYLRKKFFWWSVVVGRIVVGTRPPLRDGRRTTGNSIAKFGKGTVAYDHTTLKAPVLVRSPQLSSVGPAQYLDGWPPGNSRCCRPFFFLSDFCFCHEAIVKNQQSVQYTHRGNFYAALQRPLENALSMSALYCRQSQLISV